MRYVSEKVGRGGAVLDTKTGLREWFNWHREAITEAALLNGTQKG
jgi:hypothetical protein